MASKSQRALEWPVQRPRGWGTPTQARALTEPWYGLDTERDAKTGEFICGFAVGERVIKFEKLWDLEPGTYWVWNLAYDIEGILRDLKNDDCWAARADGAAFDIHGGTACYYHGKRFDWKSSDGRRVVFLEASSFFGRVPLSKMGAKKGVDASKMSYARYHNDENYRREVDEYCIQDARIVYQNMRDLAAGLAGLDNGRLGVLIGATPGATARRFVARLGPYPPVVWATHHMFLKSYCGGRFEITKRGILHDVKQYDIVSAYPWALSHCPWLTESAYHRSTRRLSDDSLYGSYEVSFNSDEYLGIAPRWRDGIRVYSKAEFKTWLTRPELNFIQRRGIDYRVHRGVEVFDNNASSLWADCVHELFRLKKDRKGTSDSVGAKIVLNSQYGILIQLVRRSGKWVKASEAVNPVDFAGTLALEEPPREFEGGKYYAPVYAGNLTALTRVKLLEAALDSGVEGYIGGHTDSVLTTGRITKGLGDGLGEWQLEETAKKAAVSKTGMYALNDKVKMRGITRDGGAEMLWHPTHQRKTRRGIKSAKTWDEVSLIQPKTVVNNFQVEMKRKWARDIDLELIEREEFIDSEALSYV